MKKYQLIILVLSLFLLACSGEKADQKTTTDKLSDSAAVFNESMAIEVADGVMAYYFYTTKRCPSCEKIEAYSREAIESGFRNDIAEGHLQFVMINTDEEEHRHYLKDYSLYTKSVVISKIKNGAEVEWKNLDKIWDLLGDKDQFIDYVQAEIKPFIEIN